MVFLIGVLILIVFIVGFYLYIKGKITRTLNGLGLSGIGDIIREARLEDQEIPKSLASMDNIYLEQIKKDFPSININELKRNAEKIILDCFNGIEEENSSNLKGKMKSFADAIINDNKGHNVSYDNIKIHNTVITNYKKDSGVATIYFGTSFEYYLNKDGDYKKIQDRVKTEFIYVIDTLNVEESKKVLGIHCPNCGSPITSLGDKNCSYCGGSVIDIISRVFTCNDIVRY